jgi:isopenicillin-N N-acyltransferase-like protein
MHHTPFFLIISVLFACTFYSAEAAYCNGKPAADAPANLLGIVDALPQLKFLRSVKNGKLYRLGEGKGAISVVHLYGSSYEMGYAHGSLLKDELNEFIPRLWAYLEKQVTSILQSLPDWLAKLIADFGLDAGLDFTYELTRHNTGIYFFEEMQGIADGSGIDYKTIRRIHMIGEITKGACSMFGVWGNAIPKDGPILQLRAFDWDVDGPYKDVPSLMIYHTSNGHPFINIGFIGWIGSFSGLSSTQLAISEIGVSFPDSSFGTESRVGIPFTFILRDILQFDNTLDDSINRLVNAKRTCNLIFGVGDGKMRTVRSFQYSHSVLNVLDDQNLLPYNDTWHPRIKDVVYHGMDWLCPGYNQVLGKQLMKFYGNITIDNAIRDIVARTQTGNLQVSIYDLTNLVLYYSTSAPSGDAWITPNAQKYAYERQFYKFDAKILFNEPPSF